MKLPALTLLAGVGLLQYAIPALAQSAVASVAGPQPTVGLRTPVDKGCYNSAGNMTNTQQFQGTYGFQTAGYCQRVSVAGNYPVMALSGGSECYCGMLLPSPDNKQPDYSTCNAPCSGDDQLTCGGDNTWQVLLSGITYSVGVAPKDSNPPGGLPASSTSSAVSVVTVQASSVVQSVTPTAAKISEVATSVAPKKSGPNAAGIAAGVVVGVVVLGAIAGAAFFFLRQKRRREIEAEHQRHAAVSSFIGNGQKPGSAGSNSYADSRLDPTVMQRRISDGSIADNQDYSRRILKVTNPDDGR